MEFCVIDDDKIYQFLVKKTIKSVDKNFIVNLFEDGLEAITTFKNKGICCTIILLDLNMPNMDGWQFIKEYEKLQQIGDQKHKIYIATSSISKADREKANQFKIVQGYLTKPITKEKIKDLATAV